MGCAHIVSMHFVRFLYSVYGVCRSRGFIF